MKHKFSKVYSRSCRVQLFRRGRLIAEEARLERTRRPQKEIETKHHRRGNGRRAGSTLGLQLGHERLRIRSRKFQKRASSFRRCEVGENWTSRVSECGGATFLVPDANSLLYFVEKDLTVSDFPGRGMLDNRVDRRID